MDPTAYPPEHAQVATQFIVDADGPGSARWIVVRSRETAVTRLDALVVEVEGIVIQVYWTYVAQAIRRMLRLDARGGIEQPSVDAPRVRQIERGICSGTVFCGIEVAAEVDKTLRVGTMIRNA